ncbi:hypothetical protein BRADI_1g60182v3 [Brachypodium distachyon]|uniref:RNase H type-1 domain-containing protein n=1 Tax=Brachypodium distachyon TaxID=15368 RepID=A0A0Q3LED4_BRADI|nr:hypothetical protein BRADI_1g60182v3 [Brachypodium distachyon]
MSEAWDIPSVDDIVYTGPEWLLDVLRIRGIDVEARGRVILLIWRLWQLRNDVTDDKPLAPIEATRRYPCSYADTLFAIDQNDGRDVIKGKQVVGCSGWKQKEHKTRLVVPCDPWPRPLSDWIAVSTDGSFKDGEAGLGAIIRDDSGEVLVSAYRYLPHCSDALEAEAEAALEGIRLAIPHANHVGPTLNAMEVDRSGICFILSELRRVISGDRELVIKKINCSQNRVADLLANLGRRARGSDDVLLNQPHPNVMVAVAADCNPIIE